MQQDGYSKEALSEGLKTYCLRLLEEIPPQEDLESSLSFSPGFEKRMEGILEQRRKPFGWYGSTLGKRIAAVLLTVALVGTILMNVDAIRAPILHWIVEVYETFTRIEMEPDGEASYPEQIEEFYGPRNLPEGFVLSEEHILEPMLMQIYVRGEEYLEWMQACVSVVSHLDTEGTTIYEMDRQGKLYRYFENKGITRILWEEQGYLFLCSGTLSLEELFDVILKEKK